TRRPCKASTCAACSRPARVPAMPAASCRRAWMASRSPKRWPGRCWPDSNRPPRRATERASMKLDDIKKLHQKKYRAEFGHFLVEGEHLLLELQKAAVHDPRLLRSQLYVTGAYEHWQSPFKTHLISERQMAQIADTKTPQGILAVVPMPETAAPLAASAANE